MPKIIEEEREDEGSPEKPEPSESDQTTSEKKKTNRFKHVFHHKSISTSQPLNLSNNAP
tara:strand:+ start:116 stop:292 length:177 start_codon:yes stop_codon:yes gene_type:complete